MQAQLDPSERKKAYTEDRQTQLNNSKTSSSILIRHVIGEDESYKFDLL